jgi:DNA-binding transcriptional LysR family regulator
VTQPHLTRQLQELEEELGVPLFVREHQRLHITEEGRYLKQQARQIFALLDRTEEQVRMMHEGLEGKLSIGAIETLSPLFVPGWIRSFRERHPGVTYEIWTANSQDVLERLDEGLLDVALVRGTGWNPGRYGAIELMQEGWCAVSAADMTWQGISCGTISLAELSGRDLIVPIQRTEQIRKLFSEQDLEAHIMCEFSPLANGIVLVEEGLGTAILPVSATAAFAGHRVEAKKLEGSELSHGCLVWRSDRIPSKVAQAFIDMVCDIQEQGSAE